MDQQDDARGDLEDPELMESVKDSLRRQVSSMQIIEVRKQIDEQRNRNRSRALDLRRSTDNQKATLILHTLSLRKEVHEAQSRLQDHKLQWKTELTRLVFSLQVIATQNHESFYDESRRAKVVALQRMLRFLDFDYVPLVLRNLRASSVLLKAAREVQEEETTNDRGPESCERDKDEDTERIDLEETPKVTVSHAMLTDDIRAALTGSVYDDPTERPSTEAKIEVRLSRLREQIHKYIRGERLNSKGHFPSETVHMFEISSDKSESREDFLEEMESQGSNATLQLTKSPEPQVSVLSLSRNSLDLHKKLEAMSPIAKPEYCSSDLSLSNSDIGESRRSHSLVLTSPRENESLFASMQQPEAPICPSESRPITVEVESIETVPRVEATAPKRPRPRRWRRWLCGCLCAH